jgi:hypothetical protein
VAEDIQLLEKSLAFVQDDLASELALALLSLADSESVSVAELEELLDQEALEVVLLGFTWRMILPVSGGSGTMAWEDARIPVHDGSRLKMPEVVRLLVRQACSSGQWQPDRVLDRTSPLLAGQSSCLPGLRSNIRQYAPGQVISANELRAAFREAGLDLPMDSLVAHWKGAGVLSPRLSSLSSVSTHRSPQYELNPSVFRAA